MASRTFHSRWIVMLGMVALLGSGLVAAATPRQTVTLKVQGMV